MVEEGEEEVGGGGGGGEAEKDYLAMHTMRATSIL